jgi:hypothetical protein
VADDLSDNEFWDGEEEGGYFEKDRFSRVWLLSMGILSVMLVAGVVALAFLALFRPTPPPTPVPLPGGETEAETEATPTPVMVQDTPVSPLSTSIPVPAVPTEIAIGIYVQVGDTGGSDLSFRAGPSTNHTRLKVIAEGAVLKVLDGPVEADGYVWWQLQDVSDGMVGWAVADYLQPTVP